MSKGARWRAEVKAALAASHRQQRQRRGKRQDASFRVTGPGMLRVTTVRASDGDGDHEDGVSMHLDTRPS
jgi:hypothetical protein